MALKNQAILWSILKDADDFATFKKINCPPIYFLGGAGCILAGYLERATIDLDFVDCGYEASVGKVFRLFDRFDMLDLYVTTLAPGFAQRASMLSGFQTMTYFVLSKEDILVSKLGRYADKDKEDIRILIKDCDRALLDKLIQEVSHRTDLSPRVKEAFLKNSKSFKEKSPCIVNL